MEEKPPEPPAPKKPTVNINSLSLINYIAIGTIVATLVWLGVGTDNKQPENPPQQQTVAAESVTDAPTETLTSNPKPGKLLRLNLSLSSPKDLKVKEGDTVTAGQVLADRVEEQSALSAQRQDLILQYQQLQARTIPTPPAPVSVPAVNQLPPTSYAEEEAAIASAGLSVRQAERAFQLQQQKIKQPPLEASNAVDRAEVEVENQQRLVQNQQRILDAVAVLKNLPEAVTEHEQEVLKQKQADLKQAEADYKQAQGKLSAASQVETEKLVSLSAALEKSRAEQQLAIAKLQTKKDQKAYTQYEASITAARRAEERNQSIQNYSQQLTQAEQQQRDRSFQLAQLKAKIAEVDQQIATTSVVTSPYNATVRSIKIQKQTNNELTAELILVVSGNPPATSPGSDTLTSTSSQPFITPTAATN